MRKIKPMKFGANVEDSFIVMMNPTSNIVQYNNRFISLYVENIDWFPATRPTGRITHSDPGNIFESGRRLTNV